MFLRITILMVLALSLVACNRDNFSAQRNPDGGVDITVTATEAEVNTMLSNALARGEGNVRNATIDLQSGQIVITGEVQQQDGSGNFVPATLNVGVTVVEGRLAAQVNSINVSGWSADDARLTQINQRIEDALQGRAQRDNPNVNFTSITITDTNLTFELTAQRSNN